MVYKILVGVSVNRSLEYAITGAFSVSGGEGGAHEPNIPHMKRSAIKPIVFFKIFTFLCLIFKNSINGDSNTSDA